MSIILAVLDIKDVGGDQFGTISKVIRGIFRFLRIFIILRKVNQFKYIKRIYSKNDIKTPIEMVLETVEKLKESIEDEKFLDELEWLKDIT